MKTRMIVYIIGMLTMLPGLLCAQKKKQDSGEQKHRIVIQFNDADSVSQVRVVMQVDNIRKIWAEAEIEVVCLGGGLDLLTKKSSKSSSLIDAWSSRGVTFAACNNSMMIRKITKEDLLPQAVVVPSAIIELASKQEAGWSYFRGGK